MVRVGRLVGVFRLRFARLFRAGLLAGISAALLQQHFGLVNMPGGFMVSAYPCVLEAGDVLMTAGGVALTGFLISLLAARGKS